MDHHRTSISFRFPTSREAAAFDEFAESQLKAGAIPNPAVEVDRPGAWRFSELSSVDPNTIVLSVLTSAMAAGLVQGLISVLRDFLMHRWEVEKIALQAANAASRISISVGDKKIEVDRSTPESEWQRIYAVLLADGTVAKADLADRLPPAC
jgi:hypothetical protein